MPPESTRLGVDLSANVVRVIEGAMGGQMRCAAAQLPEGAWAAGKVRDPVAVATALKQVMARSEITATRALVAVSDAIATFRVLDVQGGAGDQAVIAAVAKELALDPERIVTRWVDIRSAPDRRRVFAAAWDRADLKMATDAVRQAGLEPMAVELKSIAIARTVMEASCIVVDLVADPAELFLLDGSVPHTWHAFRAAGADDLAQVIAAPVQSVIRFHQRNSGSTFGPESPIYLSAEQDVPPPVLGELAKLTGRPAQAFPAPARVPANVRHSTYLTCLGLIMRRTW